MEIEIVWGTSEGGTELGAFDGALAAAGIHNYNLVTLSSVIPGDATVSLVGTHERRWPVGEFVATVLSENTSTVPGETIAAGIGWALADEGGVFYEVTAQSEANVEELLRRGIQTARDVRADWHWQEDSQTKVVEHPVEQNGAAVVAAVYRPV